MILRTLKILALSIALFAGSMLFANNHEYHLAFSDSLNKVTVKIKLKQSERSLRARDSYSSIFIRRPKECKTQESINFRDARLYLDPTIRCIEYSARLNQKQDSYSFDTKSKAMVSTPSEWLFLPSVGNSEKIDLIVSYPKNKNFSAPWERTSIQPRRYQLTASPQSADGLIIVGDFEQRDIKHKGTTLRTAYLPRAKTNYADIDAWLKATVDNVSKTYGYFPHPSPQIIISPIANTWSRKQSPVPFGRVVRDYGESVQFFIDQRQTLNQFKADWTATHEFAHLLLPYINWKNRWLSEGFASYYQNVLMARAGEYSEQKAWQKLYAGFKRGERAVPELSPNSAAREGWGANMKVYWSGAALALLADVRLREISNGEKSLDTTLAALQKCCLPSSRTWSGSQLMRKLDQLSETKVFSTLYQEHANKPGFFPYEEAFKKLGIDIKYGHLRFNKSNTKQLALRKAIISKQ